MLNRIFPKQFDNTYRGYTLAIWLLVPLVLFKLLMGINVAGLNPWIGNRFVAVNADGFPLDTFGAEAASIVMFLFASWGLALLVLSLLGVVVLIRYRAMIPLMYLLLSLEQFGRKGISLMSPIVKTVQTQDISAGALINYGLMAALLIGLALSLGESGKTMNERNSPA
jgi:hypothetical protein